VIVDAHCHASDVWFEPVEPLLFQMDRNGVAVGVLTQVLGQYDNGYQEDCVRRHPGRLVSVVAVDPADERAPDQVKALASRGAKGLRLRPNARSPGPDPYAVWTAARDAGLVVSCGGPAAQILSADFSALIEALPDLVVVIEHLGGWSRPDCDGEEETRDGIRALGRYPNISLKVPALGQLAKRDPLLPPSGRSLSLEPGAIVLDMLKAFGAERLMWGSDFPPVASREGYANALNWTRELFEGESAAVVDEVFGGAARRVFSISPK
jgi:L-fuconolactonase